MSRFTSLLQLGGISGGPSVLVDIGSQTTKFLYQNRVIKEPTFLVYQESSGQVLSVGKIAEQQSALLSKGLASLKPIKEGKVKNTAFLAQYLEQSLPKILKRKSAPQQGVKALLPTSLSLTLSAPLQQTKVQAQAYERSVREAQFQLQAIVPSALAAFATAQRENIVGSTACLLDFGAELTQISIFIAGELRYATTIYQGGKKLSHLIQHIVRTRHHCDISWQTAEKIKAEIGTLQLAAGKKEVLPHLVVRGRNILTNTPQSLTLQAADISEELLHATQEWIAEVQVFLGQLPGANVSEILEGGVIMYGGGSLLRGLPSVMEDVLHSSVTVPTHPQTTVVQGLLYHDKK